MIRTWLTNARGRFIWRLRFAGYTVATHQKTQQGLKHLLVGKETGCEVATHQKTQQGLKQDTMEVPVAQLLKVATHQKNQQGLKLIYNTQEVQQ